MSLHSPKSNQQCLRLRMFDPPAPIPQINFVSKLLREADSSAVAQLRSRDPDHPLLALLKQRQDAEREKDVYVRPMMPWACSGPRPRLLSTWSMPPCVRGGW